MRTPESEIKEAVLHPVEEVRLTAVDYFSYGDDPTVMPLVIEAVEKYGRKNGFSILRDAERLTQTKESTAWLVDELKKKWNPGDVYEDNYRVAVALLLCRADWDVLPLPLEDVLEFPSFPEELSYEIQARTTTKSIGWDRAWEGFLLLGEATRKAGKLSRADLALVDAFVEELARCGQDKVEFIHDLLQDDHEFDLETITWMDFALLDLVGEMRIADASPYLAGLIMDEEYIAADATRTSCATAMKRIGGDSVVKALDDYWHEEEYLYLDAGSVLGHIHTDECETMCLRHFRKTKSTEVSHCLAHALLRNFSEDTIEEIRDTLPDNLDDHGPDDNDLRYKLLTTAAIMGVSFRDYEEWYDHALARNWDCMARPWPIRDHLDGSATIFGGDDVDEYPAAEEYDSDWGDVEDDVDPVDTIRKETDHVGRNDPCPCGSGKKFKKCCKKKQNGFGIFG